MELCECHAELYRTVPVPCNVPWTESYKKTMDIIYNVIISLQQIYYYAPLRKEEVGVYCFAHVGQSVGRSVRRSVRRHTLSDQ